MGRSEVILNYSFFPPFSLSCAELLAITQQHILKKFIRVVKETDTQIFSSSASFLWFRRGSRDEEVLWDKLRVTSYNQYDTLIQQ